METGVGIEDKRRGGGDRKKREVKKSVGALKRGRVANEK